MPMNSGYEIRAADPSSDTCRSSDWQHLELGPYQSDIPLWLSLAAGSPDPILELGAGAGRVTFPLLETGHAVIAIEADPELAAYLQTEGSSRDLPLSVRSAPVEASSLDGREIGLVIGPMQFLHYLSPDRCRSVLGRFAGDAEARPMMAFAVLRESDLSEGVFEFDLLPDMVESNGWILSSRIRRIVVTERRIVIERLRETVSPSGSRRLQRVSEGLWRYRPAEIETAFEGLGYQLAASSPIPAEAGTVPSDLLVFEPHGERRTK